MKKFVKVLWILAACMAALGVLITAGGFAWCMRVVDRLTPEESVPMVSPIDIYAVDTLQIDLGVGDVKFEMDDEARIEATGYAENDLKIEQEGNVVRVVGRDTVGGSHILNLGLFRVDWLGRLHTGTLEKRVVTVYLPERMEFAQLDIATETGDITGKLIGGFAEKAVFACETGKISISELRCEELVCESSTGNIRLEDMYSGQRAVIGCNTGNVTAVDCDWAELTLNGGTGSHTFEACTVSESAMMENSTDDVRIKGGSWKDLKLDVGTGSAEFEGHLEGQCEVTASTGDVKLRLDEDASQYTAELHVSTGKCEVQGADMVQMGKKEYAVNPGASMPNELKIDVSTGDIVLVFAQE